MRNDKHLITSIGFPKMFSNNSTSVVYDLEASAQNIKSLLYSEKGEFLGDPFYGVRLKRYIFNQNNFVLNDILIDEIYTQVSVFMPQFLIKRENIKVINNKTGGKSSLNVEIKALSKKDFEVNTFNLVLFESED